MRALRPARWARALVSPMLAALALLPLALLESAGSLVPVAIVASTAIASGLLRGSHRTDHPVATAAPFVVALIAVVAVAPPTLAAEGLAGVAGVGLLVAATWSPERRSQRILGGLFLPASAVALAWVVALALPVGTQDLRVALLVLLAALGVLAWALPRAGPERLATAS